MKKITIATLLLPHAARGNELRQLRDQFVQLIGREHSLAHGHTPDGAYIHRYPLVQYRRDKIIGVNAGADLLLTTWMQHRDALGDVKLDLSTFDLALTDQLHTYYMHRWLPLSTQNYQRWKTMTEEERKVELERLLTAHLLTMMREVDWYIDKTLYAKIIQVTNQKKINMMNRKTADWEETYFISFGVLFETNIRLPYHIGLGRGVRLGYGVLESAFAAKSNSKANMTVDLLNED